MEEPKSGLGKWMIGAFAVIAAYGFGYDAGKTDGKHAASAWNPPPIVAAAPSDELTDEVPLPSLEPVQPFNLSAVDITPTVGDSAPDPGDEGEDEGDAVAQVAQVNPAPEASDDAVEPDDEPLLPPNMRQPASQRLADAYPAPTARPTPSLSGGFGCAENGSCYGDISPATGLPKTVAVRGYFRRDGTYVRGHYRSHR